MPCTLTSALNLKVTGTQALHSPALRSSFVSCSSISAWPVPSVHFTVNGMSTALLAAISSSRALSLSLKGPCFFLSSSSRSSCLRIGLSGPFRSGWATPPSKSSRLR